MKPMKPGSVSLALIISIVLALLSGLISGFDDFPWLGIVVGFLAAIPFGILEVWGRRVLR